MSQIIFLNGPARSGKDVVQKIISDYTYSIHYKMSKPVKEGAFGLLGVGNLTSEEIEKSKDDEIEFSVDIKFFEDRNANSLKKALLERKAKEKNLDNLSLSQLFFEETQMGKINITHREFLIYISEDVLKPLFGDDIFGKTAVNYLKTINNIESIPLIISDCGFEQEMIPIIDYFGKASCLVAKISRPGFDFVGDSRNYVDSEKLGLDEIWINNNGNITDLKDKTIETLKKIL